MTTESHPRPAPSDRPEDAAYLDAVRALLPQIRARAAETESLGRLPDDTVRALDEVGVFRALQPRRWGGLELHPATFFESVVLLGSACGATGWVAGVLSVHPWEVALLPDQSQRDIWGTDTHTRLSSSYAPTGRVERVDGGYRLSGEWRFSSGVDLCDWAILGGVPVGDPEGDLHAFLVPRREYTVDPESWQVAGLAGTGSKSLTVADAFVPAHRCHRVADVNQGLIPGWEVNEGPLYHLPWMNGIFAYGIAAPAIGAATGALEAYVAQSRTRTGAYGGPPVASMSSVQVRLAAALADVEDTRLRMQHTWGQFYDLACAGTPLIPPALQARCRYEAARAISICLRAVLSVFEVAGGSVMHLSNPIQRFLRDLLAMRNHPMGALEATAVGYARAHFQAE